MIIGFIGAGKMARALAVGLVHAKVTPASDLICSSRTMASGLPFLEANPGARWTHDNVQLVRDSDLIVLALKPQLFAEVVPTLREVSADRLFLSIGTGMTIERISEWLHPAARIVRAMPNTPAQVGAGASVYAGGADVTKADFAQIHRILASVGRAWQVEENQIDIVTALSGSGPAYVFHFIEALAMGALKLGLPEELARELAVQTVFGSAQLAVQSKHPPMELAAHVKSPRGTTLAGCAVLEKGDALNKLVARCLAAAKRRAESLSRGEE